MSKHRFRLSEAESVQLVINAFYLLGLGVVGVGQVTGLFPRLGWMALGAAAIIELGGVTFARIADYRRRLGEKAYAARLLSAAFAAMSVAVNWVGHQDDWLIAGILACLSALLYVVYLINSEFRRRDELRRKKKLPPTTPDYGLWQWLRRPVLTGRARDLFRRDPTLGLYGSLDAAVREQRTNERRHALVAVARAHMTKAFGPHITALIMSVADPDEFAEELTRQVNLTGHVTVLAGRATPEILDASMAREDRNRRAKERAEERTTEPTETARADRVTAPRGERVTDRVTDRVTAPRDTRSTRTPSTRSRAASPRASATRSRGTAAAARDAWWNEPRDAFYAIYAQRLDEEGVEVGGEELAGGVGIADLGNARTARLTYLRPRYAEEAARNTRQPRDGVVLPTALQIIIAKNAARGMTGELRQIGSPQ